VMFLHGTHDKKVALEVSEFLYNSASGARSFVRVNFGTHGLDTTRDVAYPVLRSWVLAALERWHRAAAGQAVPGSRPHQKEGSSLLPPLFQAAGGTVVPANTAPKPADDEEEVDAAPPTSEANASSKEGQVVSLDSGILSVGHPLRLVADEVSGAEHWRLVKTEGRLERACKGLASHPLAGLLGYSE